MIALDPVATLRSLFWGTTIVSGFFIIRDRRVRAILRQGWPLLALALALTLVWRIPFNGRFFQGLEYEDSYVYSVAGRQLALVSAPNAPGFSPMLASVCSIGSLEACQGYSTYSGHYLGLSYMIAGLTRLVGFSPSLPNVIAVMASCVTVVLLFLLAGVITGNFVAPFAAAAIFAMTPAFAVEGVASFAEPVSNACVALVLLLFNCFISTNHKSRLNWHANWIALTLSMLLAIVIKRENTVLAIWFLFIVCLYFAIHKTSSKREWIFIGLASIVTLAFAIDQLGINTTMVNETQEYGQFPFSFAGLQGVLPVFLRMYTNLGWYAATWVVVIVGVVNLRSRRTFWFLPTILLSYLLLYASHVRSYYQLHGNDVTPFELLRYSINVMCLWSLLGGIGVSAVVEWSRYLKLRPGIVKTLGIPCIAVLAMASFVATWRMRNEMVEEEYHRRIKPAETAIRYALRDGLNAYVVTPEPLLIQIYGTTTIKVVDRNLINDELIARLQTSGDELLYIDEPDYRDSLNLARFEAPQSSVSKRLSELLYEDADVKLWRIE